MEDTLRDMGENEKACLKAVLILVLMEDTLRALKEYILYGDVYSLNPCFNGRYSQRAISLMKENNAKVLILVLMEDTLRDDGKNL
jgi:hypothetical protein